MSRYLTVHVATVNDTNGNPRRATMVYRLNGELRAIVDERYRGRSPRALREAMNEPDAAFTELVTSIPVPVSYYRDCVRDERAL